MRVKKSLHVALAAVVFVSLTACTAPDDEASGPDSPPTVSTQPASPAPAESAAQEPVEETEEAPVVEDETSAPVQPAVGDHGPATCADLGLGPDDTAAPPQLAAVGAPFYECVEEMSAIESSDPLFVGSYDTDQESIAVEMFVKDQFEVSDWEVMSTSLDGDHAVTQAQKPGYHLVIAIGPSRSPDAVTSLHYTLRSQ